MAMVAAVQASGRQKHAARALLLRLVMATGVFAVALAAGTALRGVGGASAPSSFEAEVASVHAVLTDLHQQFFRPVDDVQVLSAAWANAVEAAEKKGVSVALVKAPDLGHGQALKEFDRALTDLNRLSADKLSPRELGRAAIAGAAGSVHENHTYYLGPENWVQRSEATTRYAGVGVTISQQDGAFFVGEVYPDSPAANGGLRSGDRILAVDGRSVDGWGVDELVTRMRGKPDTEVTLDVRRGDGWAHAQMLRQMVVVPAFQSSTLADGTGYIRLRSFPPAGAKLPSGKTVPEAFRAALDTFEQQGVTAWVLDLRGNGGGYLDTLSAIASALLPSGNTYFLSHTQHGDQASTTSGGQHLPARPLTVLVDGGSASASEILSVALQEDGRATVVGLKSAGVANAADLDALPNGGGLSVTAVQTLTPVQRRPLDGQGVLPDVVIDQVAADVMFGRDRQLDVASAIARRTASLAAREAATPASPVAGVSP